MKGKRKTNARTLDTIATDIHKLERNNIFAVGKLLLEAKEQLLDEQGHGHWQRWLWEEFEQTPTTAQNYMNAARLATKNQTVCFLKVPARIIYQLVDEDLAEDLPAIIAALAKASKHRHLKVAEAEEVIELTGLQIKFGNHPNATLQAMGVIREDIPWRDAAIKALAAKQPDTEEAADKVVADVQRDYVARLFRPVGTLPEVPSESLGILEDVPEDRRESVMTKLLDAPKPLTEEDVRQICFDEEPEDDDEADDDTPPSPPSPPTPAPPLAQELLSALQTLLRFADTFKPTRVSGISTVELMRAEQFIAALRNAMDRGDAVKRAADRAQARSRSVSERSPASR
jgi:hypothetical protein